MVKASDYYFMVLEEDEDTSYLGIVNKKYWEDNECLRDQCISKELEHILPNDFHEVMESHFEYYVKSDYSEYPNIEKGRAILLELGFEEIYSPW